MSRNKREGRYAGSYCPYKEPRKHIRDKYGLYEWLNGSGEDIVYKKLDVEVSSEYALSCYFCRPRHPSHK